jgi:ABC-type antimicrobial peptide transport system permease subunit
MDPVVMTSMFSWYVWSGVIIGTFLMAVIGTWLVARRIKK